VGYVAIRIVAVIDIYIVAVFDIYSVAVFDIYIVAVVFVELKLRNIEVEMQYTCIGDNFNYGS
jgi:hypothetical protein